LAAKLYFWKAMTLCQLTGVEPSLLLHPLDFLGADDDRGLAFFPAMDLPSERKLKLVGEVLKMMTERYHVVPLREYAYHAIERNRLRKRGIQFARAG